MQHPRLVRTGKAESLVDTAMRVFHKNGFHATGIQQLLEEAGVSKMTLYGNFDSKDELILASLRKRDTSFRDWFQARTNARATSPRDALLAVFDTLDEWIRSEDFYGCMFINASAEFAQATDPVHVIAAEHKRLVLDYICGLAENAGAADPKRLGTHIFLLTEGAIVDGQVRSNKNAAQEAKEAARLIVDALLPAT